MRDPGYDVGIEDRRHIRGLATIGVPDTELGPTEDGSYTSQLHGDGRLFRRLSDGRVGG